MHVLDRVGAQLDADVVRGIYEHLEDRDTGGTATVGEIANFLREHDVLDGSVTDDMARNALKTLDAEGVVLFAPEEVWLVPAMESVVRPFEGVTGHFFGWAKKSQAALVQEADAARQRGAAEKATRE